MWYCQFYKILRNYVTRPIFYVKVLFVFLSNVDAVAPELTKVTQFVSMEI